VRMRAARLRACGKYAPGNALFACACDVVCVCVRACDARECEICAQPGSVRALYAHAARADSVYLTRVKSGVHVGRRASCVVCVLWKEGNSPAQRALVNSLSL
jgi:hypothetical protein